MLLLSWTYSVLLEEEECLQFNQYYLGINNYSEFPEESDLWETGQLTDRPQKQIQSLFILKK